MDDVRAASIGLATRSSARTASLPRPHACPSPRSGNRRGSQVSFQHEQGYAIMALASPRRNRRFPRARFDPLRLHAPLYIGEAEVMKAVDILADIMTSRLWDRPRASPHVPAVMASKPYDLQREGADSLFKGRACPTATI